MPVMRSTGPSSVCGLQTRSAIQGLSNPVDRLPHEPSYAQNHLHVRPQLPDIARCYHSPLPHPTRIISAIDTLNDVCALANDRSPDFSQFDPQLYVWKD